MTANCYAHEQPSHQPATEFPDHLGVLTPFHRGQEICTQGRRVDYWYRLVSGAACASVVRPDGKRQIIDLLLPGDFFGFTPWPEYEFTVQAAAKGTRVAVYQRRRLEMLADQDPQLARQIRRAVFDAMARLQAQLLTLGRITATEKVGSFLLALAERLPDRTSSSVVLPISRYDIADCLAMSVETVSRAITDLKHRGAIELSGTRAVRIADPEALGGGEWDSEPHDLCARDGPVKADNTRAPSSVRNAHAGWQ